MTHPDRMRALTICASVIVHDGVVGKRLRRLHDRRWLGGVGVSTVLAVAATLLAPQVAVAPVRADVFEQRLQATIQRISGNPALGSSVGVHVRDVRRVGTLASLAGDSAFIPASTMKVITAFTTLSSLGADHRFTTSVHYDDRNTIVLHGGGDPVLTESDIELLATRTARGLRFVNVTSSVTVDIDDRLFGTPVNAPGWEAGDMPAYVSAVRGLSMLGSYSADTAVATGQVFVKYLRQQGIQAALGERVAVDNSYRRIARFRGNDLGEAIRIMMLTSENNVAESLFRHVAIAQDRPATWNGSRRAAREILRLEGMNIRGSAFIDGSGLSYRNRLTPRLLTDVLARFAQDERFFEARNSLPTAGRTGTLRWRFQTAPASCARGEVQAKTGSLPMTVSTLAGLTVGTDGRTLSFAILVNNRPSTAAWASTSLAIDTIAAAVHGCIR